MGWFDPADRFAASASATGTRVAALAAFNSEPCMDSLDAPADDPEHRDHGALDHAATSHDADAEVLSDDTQRVIPVIAETLDVGRRELHGAVRIRKIVHENPITVDEMLRDERVSVERVPIGRRVDGPVGIRYEGDVMIVPIVEERLVVEKRLVLTEEIRVRREVGVRHEPQRVTLRQEQVLVERFDPKTREWSTVDTTPAAPFSGSGASNGAASAQAVDPAAMATAASRGAAASDGAAAVPTERSEAAR